MSTTNDDLRERIAEELRELRFGDSTVYQVADRILAALPSPGGERENPTPESLRAMAEWFDNPNESPGFTIQCGGRLTPGRVLRMIASSFEHATSTSETP